MPQSVPPSEKDAKIWVANSQRVEPEDVKIHRIYDTEKGW